MDWVISLGNAFSKQYELYTSEDEHSALLHRYRCHLNPILVYWFKDTALNLIFHLPIKNNKIAFFYTGIDMIFSFFLLLNVEVMNFFSIAWCVRCFNEHKSLVLDLRALPWKPIWPPPTPVRVQKLQLSLVHITFLFSFCFSAAWACFFKRSMTGLMFITRSIGCINMLTLQFQQIGLVWQKPLDWYLRVQCMLFTIFILQCVNDLLLLTTGGSIPLGYCIGKTEIHSGWCWAKYLSKVYSYSWYLGWPSVHWIRLLYQALPFLSHY